MYSSPARSRVTVPWTRSRNAWAAGDWAASKRPASTTAPSAPKSILNISLPSCLAECGAAGAAFRHVAVFERVDHLAHEVDAEPARPAPLERQGDVGLGRARRVERIRLALDEAYLDAARNRADVDAHWRSARPAVPHDVGEKLLERELHCRTQLFVDF